jgi:hypothetical protein
LVKFESDELFQRGLRRLKYFPLPVVYFMRATESNTARILDDYGTGISTADVDALERCCPWVVSMSDCCCTCMSKEDAAALESAKDLVPRYGEANFVLLPGPPGSADADAVKGFVAALEEAVSADSGRFAPLQTYVRPSLLMPLVCLPEVIPVEDALFTTHQPDFLSMFYSQARRKASEEAALNFEGGGTAREVLALESDLLRELDVTAWRLVSLFVTLRESPTMRFFETKSGKNRGHSSGHSWAKLLCQRVEVRIAQWKAANSWWIPIGSEEDSRAVKMRDVELDAVGDDDKGAAVAQALYGDSKTSATLLQPEEPTEPATCLVVERLDDLGSLLSHDMTYQVAVYDMLHLDPGKPFAVGGKSEGEDHRLDASDYVWGKARYLHILDADKMVQKGLRAQEEKAREYARLNSTRNVQRLAAFAQRQKFERGERWDHEYRTHSRIMEALYEHIDSPGLAPARAASLELAGSGRSEGHELLDIVDLETALLCSGIHIDYRTRGMDPATRTKAVMARLESIESGDEEKARLIVLWLLTQPELPTRAWMELYNAAKAAQDLARTSGGAKKPLVGPCVLALQYLNNFRIPLERRTDDITFDCCNILDVDRAREAIKSTVSKDGEALMGTKVCKSRLEEAAEAWEKATRPRLPGEAEAPIRDSNGHIVVDGLSAQTWAIASGVPFAGTRRPVAAASRPMADASGRDDDVDGDDDGAMGMDLLAGLGGISSARRHKRGGGATATSAAAASAAASGKKGKKKKTEEDDVYTPPSRLRQTGGRLIVFVLGGVTPHEQAALNKIADASGREILVGGTSFLRPVQFFEQLERSAGPALPAALPAASVGGGTPARRA